MNIVITEQELNVRRSQGTVYLCKPCRELRHKLVMVQHDLNGRNEVVYRFCSDCLRLARSCPTCRK